MLAFIDAVHFVEYFLAAEQTGQFFPEKSGRPQRGILGSILRSTLSGLGSFG